MKCPMCGGKRFDKPRMLRAWHGPTSYGLLGPPVKASACLHCGWLVLMIDPTRLGRHGADWQMTDEEGDKKAASALEGMGADGDPAEALDELRRESEAQEDADATPQDPPEGDGSQPR